MATPTSIKIEKDIDLNSLFNLNYNFDLLKGIIEELLNNQKNLKEKMNNLEAKNLQKDSKITDLEKEIRILKETKTDKSTTEAILVDLSKIKDHLNHHDEQIKDIYSKLKGGSDGHSDGHSDQSKIIELLKALERKTESKFVVIDKNQNETNDDLAQLRKDLKKLDNAHTETVKRVDDNKERIDILFGMLRDIREMIDNLKKELNDLRDFVDRKLQEIQSQIELLMSLPGDSKGKVGEGDLKIISDLLKRLKELERSFNKYVTEARIEELWKLVLELKEGMHKKANVEDVDKLRDDLDNLKRELSNLKDQLNDVVEDTQRNTDDIRSIYKKIEEILAMLNNLKNAVSGISTFKSGGEQIDLSKFVMITVFDGFKSDTEKAIKDINSELDRLRRLIDDILAQLKTKIGEKELKALEDYLMKKIEELAVACNKKFADKNETARNFRYLEDQIKHILSLLMKKEEKGDNWLLAKRPLIDFTCASCEAYIGELKDTRQQYIPWNKYPMREPQTTNEKLYRVGSGFSRMLQMVNVDNNQGIPLAENKKDQTNYHSPTDINQRKIELKDDSRNLPKIHKRDNTNISMDEMNRESKDEQNIIEDDDIQPKVMKIFKKGKK